MTQAKISDYQIVDYGIDHAQYFAGHGHAFTIYQHACLGCGDTYAEALADALEQAAMDGFSVDLSPEDNPTQWQGKGPSASDMFQKACEREGIDPDNVDSELYYYVGLRWN